MPNGGVAWRAGAFEGKARAVGAIADFIKANAK